MLDMPKPAPPPVQPPDVRSSPPQMSADANLDRMLHAWQSRYTGGRSPSTLALAFPRLGRARSKRAVSDSRFGRKGAGAVAPPCAGRQGRRKGDRAEAGRSSFRPFGVEQTSLRPPRPVGSFGRGMVSGRRKQSRRGGRRQPGASSPLRCGNARFDIAFERALAKPGGH